MLGRAALLILFAAGLCAGQEPRELEVLTPTLPDAILARPYRVKLEAAGGKKPYTWTISDRALPKGLSLKSSSGEIAGAPFAFDRFTFTVTITDSSSPAQTAVRYLAIRVVQPLVLETNMLPIGFSGSAYRFLLLARGGTRPFKWTLAGGTLPPGLQLDGDRGLLYGTLKTDGEFHFIIQVKDAGEPSQTQLRTFTSTVLGPLALEWKRLPQVEDGGIHGSLRVSNRSRDDCDLTVIVVAVNEYGKAFTLGHQHIPLRRESMTQEIPFGFSLPRGVYAVHADAVGEVAPKNVIYRTRLVQPSLPVE